MTREEFQNTIVIGSNFRRGNETMIFLGYTKCQSLDDGESCHACPACKGNIKYVNSYGTVREDCFTAGVYLSNSITFDVLENELFEI